MNMDFVIAQEDVKTNIQLVKNGKPTPWLIAAATLEIAADAALAFSAYKVFKLLKK